MIDISDWTSARLRLTRDLTANIRLFEIEPEGQFVQPSPGSHINIAVQAGERPDTRSYSIVGSCDDGRYRIAVKRLANSRGGSAYMWSLAQGARLAITAPGNHFPLSLGRRDYLLIAGGIGITPIYTMALALREVGASFRVLYAVHCRADLALADELGERIGNRLTLFVSAEGRRIDLGAQITALAPDGELYICGPIRMFEEARRLWQASGRPAEYFRFETFGSSGRFATQAFLVKIPRLGLELTVPENRTMLEALEAAGVEMISDCRKGECGLCAMTIIGAEGTVDHRDVFFSDKQKAQGDKLCVCVSRVSGGSITIDTPDRAS
jgi:ferredoxin-NADP reductase